MDKHLPHTLSNFYKKRLDSAGFNHNAVAFCQHLNFLCIGDRDGCLYLISLPRQHLIKRITLGKEVTSLKYVKQAKSLFILSGTRILKYDFRKCQITTTKSLDFWPSVIEYVEKHEVVAVGGETFGIKFYDMSLKYQFSINYSDPSRTIESLLYIEKHTMLVTGLDNGALVAFDMKSTRLLCHDYTQKTTPRYVKYIEKEDIFISGGEEGKLHMRQYDRYQGFRGKSCLWMKKEEILGMEILRDGMYMACIHSGVNNLNIVRIKDWQIIKNVSVFFNQTGGTNLLAMEKGRIILATEKAEGFYYVMRYK